MTVFPVDHKSGGGSGKEEKQIDALGLPLVHPQHQGHKQKQERAAAHTPGGQDGSSQTAKEREETVHSRYFTPA